MENKHLLNTISPKDIDGLDSHQLVMLLDYLLRTEAFKYNLNVKDQFVPTVKITTPDQGEDGRIIFNGEVTQFLPRKRCYFQSKAGKLTAQQCANEVVNSKGELKEKVQEVIKEDGCYILFMGYDVGAKKNIESREAEITERIKKITHQIEKAGLTVDEGQIQVYDSNKISSWVNDHISAVKLVDDFCRRIKNDSFLSWKQFQEVYYEEVFKDKFYWTDKLRKTKEDLIKALVNNRTARLIGYSGIGKTKFISESFNESQSEDKNLYNGAFCYIDMGKSNVDEDDILNFLMNHKQYSGLLVIDNCSKDLHQNYASYVERQCDYLNLVTIDNDLEREDETNILLDQNLQQDVCKKILSTVEDKFSNHEFEEILNICEGYPYFANTILEHIREEDNDKISLELAKDEFKNGIIKRLIAGTEIYPDFKESDIFNVAKGISVFKSFPFIDDEYEDIQSLNSEKYKEKVEVVINHVIDSDISVQRFYKLARTNLKNERKLIERRGPKYSIRPEILAVNLAADWLENYPVTNFDTLFQRLTDVGLIQEFCDRLKSLDQVERSKSLIENYWGNDRPFVKAEVLNTELGSRLFRSVVEVNPEACILGLENTLSNFSISDLKENFGDGRRNIVWSLEKLAFREETFDKAALLLARLSIAENENYSNNSTGQFLQLFHIQLPGTEVDLDRRLGIIRELENYDDERFYKLIFKAIESGLSSGRFTRSGSASKQGSKVFEDYRPTINEIQDYWKNLVSIWVRLFEEKPSFEITALNSISNKLKTFVTNDLWDELEMIVSKAEDIKSDYVWVEGIQSLKRLISYDVISGSKKEKVKNFVTRLEPKDNFKRLIDLRVIEAPFEHRKTTKAGKETYEDVALTNLEKFAQHFVNSGESPIDYFNQLLTGKARFALQFGEEISSKVGDKLVGEYLNKGLEYYKESSEEDRNPNFLGGLFKNLSPQKQVKYIEKAIENELYKVSLFFTALKKPEKKDLEKMLALSRQGLLPITDYTRFQYGMQLEHLGIEGIIWLGNELGRIDHKGYPVALSILFLHSFQDNKIGKKYLNTIKDWLTSVNFVTTNYNISRIDDYHWSEIIRFILTENQDGDFARAITNQLIEASEDTSFTFSNYERQVFSCLFENYFDEVWPLLGEALLDSKGFFQLIWTLQSRNGTEIKEGVLFSNISKNGKNKIIEWCKGNDPKAAKRVAQLMPCIKPKEMENGKILYDWHPFALKMIEEFGSVESFMSEVGANLAGVSWTGNIAIYYQRVKNMVEKLEGHKELRVREWAKRKTKSLEKNIKRENMRHEAIYGTK